MEELQVPHLAMPFSCILPDCKESLTNSTIVSHFCSSHRVDFQDIELDENILMMVSTEENFLSYGNNVCLGIVGVKVKNTKHETDIEYFPQPFPVLIMAKRDNYQKIINNSSRGLDQQADFLTFWLSMPKVKDYRLNSILTVYNEDYSTSISKSVDVKYIPEETQAVSNFINFGSETLVINAGLLKKLASDESIIFEFCVKENLL